MTDVATTTRTTPAPSLSTARRVADEPPRTNGNSTVDKDMFLQLLVAQLKYQNPLDPASPDDFMAQTAQFTMVESLEELSKSTAASNRSQMIATASSLVGKEVTAIAADKREVKGIVTSARILDDATILRIGNTDVAFESVTSIAAAPAAPTAPTGATT
jgi:flagellar basal-body rod modification protein FlgD